MKKRNYKTASNSVLYYKKEIKCTSSLKEVLKEDLRQTESKFSLNTVIKIFKYLKKSLELIFNLFNKIEISVLLLKT